MEISEGVIRLGLRPRRITLSSISIILHKIFSLIHELLINSLNYLPSRGEAAKASEKVHIKCSAFAKKKSSYITLRIISDFIQ